MLVHGQELSQTHTRLLRPQKQHLEGFRWGGGHGKAISKVVVGAAGFLRWLRFELYLSKGPSAPKEAVLTSSTGLTVLY